MKESVISIKSKAFALRIIKMTQWLSNEHICNVLAKQCLRSGTSIGANVREAKNAQSSADFISKMNIALKEADETEYWLELLNDSGYLPLELFESIYKDCNEICRLLNSIVKSSKENIGK